MNKATSRAILFLLPVMLICVPENKGWQNGNSNVSRAPATRTRSKSRTPQPRATPPPVVELPDSKQIDTQLQSHERAVNDLRAETEKLKKTTDEISAQGTAARLIKNWDILIVATILTALIGGVGGVFLAPRVWQLFEPSQREQLLTVSNSTTELKNQSENLIGRVGLLEQMVNVIHQSLLLERKTEAVQPRSGPVESAKDPSATRLSDNRLATSSTADSTSAGPLADIGVIPPSKYVEVIRSSALPYKTIATTHDFRYPGKLVEADDGRFLIVSFKDGNNPHSLALPKFDRLSGSDEFNYYYKAIFDCERPIGGDIYVIKPARMAEDTQQGGWMLHSRGKLEIRR